MQLNLRHHFQGAEEEAEVAYQMIMENTRNSRGRKTQGRAEEEEVEAEVADQMIMENIRKKQDFNETLIA